MASVKPEIPTTDRLIELFKKCLPGHYLFGRSCYSIKNDIQVLSYDLAQASCNSMEVIGSQPSLVSISSKDELDFVNSLIKTNLNSPTPVLVSFLLIHIYPDSLLIYFYLDWIKKRSKIRLYVDRWFKLEYNQLVYRQTEH